jgi:hypothetical protein
MAQNTDCKRCRRLADDLDALIRTLTSLSQLFRDGGL